MISKTWARVMLLTSVICAGCGTGLYWHDIDLKFDADTVGTPTSAFKVGLIQSMMSRERIRGMPMYSPNSNGVVRIAHRSTSGAWVWQRRPAYLSFELFIPSVSTNGYFRFFFDETSRLPWRGLKRGTVPVRANYSDFDTKYKGRRPFPSLRAKVTPSANGGYHVEMSLPARSLRAAMASDFVPYKPHTGK